MSGVQRAFDVAIVGGRRFGNLDHEQHVGGLRRSPARGAARLVIALTSAAHLFYFAEQMAKRTEFLGSLEQIVLLALLRLGTNAYGVAVRAEIEKRTGRGLSIGAIYSTLSRLEAKGYVRSETGEATAERGGRAKRYFRVEADGLRALRASQRAIDHMTAGLRKRLGST
jgi:DNA-binding PadR family transcriptional regulator